MTCNLLNTTIYSLSSDRTKEKKSWLKRTNSIFYSHE